MQRVRAIRHDISVHVCAGEVLLVNKRAMPDENHSVGSSFRSFAKTLSCSADQLRVEPLLRWRGNRPVVRHGRRGAVFRRCPGSGNRRNEHTQSAAAAIKRIPHPPRADADGGEYGIKYAVRMSRSSMTCTPGLAFGKMAGMGGKSCSWGRRQSAFEVAADRRTRGTSRRYASIFENSQAPIASRTAARPPRTAKSSATPNAKPPLSAPRRPSTP